VGGRVDLWAAPVADNECTCRDPCLDKYRQFDSRRSEPIHFKRRIVVNDYIYAPGDPLQWMQTHILSYSDKQAGVYFALIDHCAPITKL
jgi:hypothetical protein